jgi:hypothetical protein
LTLENFKTNLLFEDGYDLSDDSILDSLFTDPDVKIICVSLSDELEDASEETES